MYPSYVENLETRLERMEKLLGKVISSDFSYFQVFVMVTIP